MQDEPTAINHLVLHDRTPYTVVCLPLMLLAVTAFTVKHFNIATNQQGCTMHNNTQATLSRYAGVRRMAFKGPRRRQEQESRSRVLRVTNYLSSSFVYMERRLPRDVQLMKIPSEIQGTANCPGTHDAWTSCHGDMFLTAHG